MNIGIVCYPTFGGSGVLATELGKALADKGHNIHFITYQQPVRLSGFHANIFYHEVRVPTYPLFDYPPYETALASTMVDVILNNNVQLLTCALCNTTCFCCIYGKTNSCQTGNIKYP
ncbi:MAG: glycosyltransferase [Chitinophagaceae bacterium]